MSEPAQHFSDMAARIQRADPQEFAGAIVIVPPEGDPIAILISEAPHPDLPQFWSIAKTRVEIRLAEAQQKSQLADPWQRR